MAGLRRVDGRVAAEGRPRGGLGTHGSLAMNPAVGRREVAPTGGVPVTLAIGRRLGDARSPLRVLASRLWLGEAHAGLRRCPFPNAGGRGNARRLAGVALLRSEAA